MAVAVAQRRAKRKREATEALSSSCLFCCGSVKENSDDEKNDLEMFFLMSERWCVRRIPNRSSSSSPLKSLPAEVDCCSKCLQSARSFNELYQELKCLEMKLDWKIEFLKEAMKRGDLRGKDFQQGKETGNEVQVFRKKFLNNCNQYLEKSNPSPQHSPVTRIDTDKDPNTVQIQPKREVVIEDSDDDLDDGTGLNFDENEDVVAEDNNGTEDPLCHSEAEAEVESNSDADSDYSPKRKSRRFSSIKTVSVSNNGRMSNKPCANLRCSDCPDVNITSKRLLVQHNRYCHTDGLSHLTTLEIEELKISRANLVLEDYEQTQWTCGEDGCNREFTLEKELDNHVLLHGNFACAICNKAQNYALDLIEHELNHSKQSNPKTRSFSCGRCNWKGPSKKECISHYLTVHLGLDRSCVRISCPICAKKFKDSFTEHHSVPLFHYVNAHDLSRLSDRSKVFRCKLCSAYFLTEKLLGNHKASIHPNGKMRQIEDKLAALPQESESNEALKCPHCSKTCSTLGKLKLHLFVHEDDTKVGDKKITEDGMTIDDWIAKRNAPFSCELCKNSTNFFTSEDLESHSKLHGRFNCDYCDEVKTFAPELSFHELNHQSNNDSGDVEGSNNEEDNNALKCRKCSFTTYSKTEYKDHHVEQHLGLQPDRLRCPICNYQFNFTSDREVKWKRGMYNHYMTVHGAKKNDNLETTRKCENCSAEFLSILQLNRHSKVVHGQDLTEGFRTCNICQKNFHKQHILRTHRLSVHKLRMEDFPFPCTVEGCLERYETELEVEVHITHRHRTVSSFQAKHCEKCGLICTTQSTFTRHMNAHERGIARPECEICKKKFKKNWHLRNHMHTHLGPESWEFLCETCSKRCPSKYALEQHRKTHDSQGKESPHICPSCGHKFSSKGTLTRHLKKVHGRKFKIQDKKQQY